MLNMINGISPFVSVIMTTYNAEKYIRESLDSVLNQTLQNMEIVCIDGRSTDNTLNIIRSYQEKDDRVKLFFQDRPGIGAAKNCGIQYATGKYITFLDADDFYVDRLALETMYEACEREQVSVCGAFRSTLFMDGSVIKENLHRNDCKNGTKFVRLNYRDRQYDYHFHSYLYDREMIVNSDARFAEVKAYDDTHFFIRAMLCAKEFGVVPVELYRYRCGPAYDWGMERANDAIYTLTDQLRLTSEHGLEVLHWLTVQRINYEYGQIFEKNVRAGDFELLERLVTANKQIDAGLLKKAMKNLPSEKWYLEPMIHRRYADCELRAVEGQFSPAYIIEPLWNLLYSEKNTKFADDNSGALNTYVVELEKQLSTYEKHKSIRLMKKVFGGIQCVKDHGALYTIQHAWKKLK